MEVFNLRIYPVNNNINFGYNEEANKRLREKLKNNKMYKPMLPTLIQTHNLCMDTENLIRKSEKRGDIDTVEGLKDMFLNIKCTFTQTVDMMFPELNYLKKELNTYSKEADNLIENNENNEDHWLLWLRDDLDPDMSDFEFDEDEITELQSSGAGVSSLSNNNVKDLNNVLEIYSPNKWSPVGMSSMGGMEELKAEIEDKLIYPIKNPEAAKLDEIEYGKRFPRGILFYGPPGCGKTFTVECVAQELGIPLLKLKVGKAGSEYVNGTSKNYENAFNAAAKMSEQNNTPILLFIDEMDGLTHTRDKESSAEDLKQIGTLLNLIETARDRGIVVVGATNKYDIVDEAIKARFDSQIYIGLPDEKTRADVLKVSLQSRTKGLALANSPEELKKVAEITNGFPNRALSILTDKAALIARADGRRDMKAEDYFGVVEANQNLKVKDTIYKPRSAQPRIGFKKNA